MEAYYAFASDVGELLRFVLEGAGLAALCKSFFAEKKKCRLVFLTYVLMMIFWKYVPWKMNGVIVHWLTAGVIFCQLLILGRSRNVLPASAHGNRTFRSISLQGGQTLSDLVYFIITFETIRWVCSVIAVNLYMVISMQAESVLFQNETDAKRLQQLWLGTFCLMELLNVIVFCVLFFWAARLFDRLYLRKNCALEPREAALLLIPSFLGIVSHLLRFSYNNIPQIVYGDVPVRIYLLWVLNDVIFLAAVFLVLHLFQRQRQQQEEQILLRQLKDMQLHVKAVEQMYDNVRGLRHDLENHALVLKGLLADGKFEEAEHYVNTFKAAADDLVYEIQSGNPVTDVILNEKKKEAAKLGISFHCAFHYPLKSKLDVFDVSMILSNGLENAFEAARQSEEPLVEIRSLRRKNIWVITIVNSCANAFPIGRANGLPPTTKAERSRHGFGLKNIRMAAEKYFGVMELSQSRSEDNCRNLVTLTVMLQLP